MDLLKNLLNRQVHFPPALIDQTEAEKSRADFDVLLSLGILDEASTPNQRICLTCGDESLDIEFISGDRAYTLCTRDKAAGRDYFNPKDLKQWNLNTPRLLSLFQKALGIETPQVNENIQGLLWGFGTQTINGISYQLFYCRNIDEFEASKLSIVTSLPYSVLFYSGTPHTTLPDKVSLAPLADFIEGIGEGGVTINDELLEQYFLQDVYQTRDGDIVLDESMVLQDKTLLFEPLRGGVFKKSAGITPKSARIIAHLFGIRKYMKHAKTLDELSSALGGRKNSISNEINKIKKVCDDNGLQPILYKYANQEWGLNSQLQCCR